MATTTTAGMEALHSLKSTEPPVWLAPDPKLSKTARTASQHLFSSLKPFATKSPFDHLLIDGFDAEQIWQQIDLQSQPLLSSLRREVKKLEKNPDEIKKLKQKQQVVVQGQKKKKVLEEKTNNNKHQEEIDYDDDDGLDMDMDMDGFDDDEVAEDESEEEEEEEEEEEREGGIEDKFLKIKELEEYLEDDEAKEYGLKSDDKKVEDDDDDDDEDDDDELGTFGDEDDEDEDEDANELENARYEDFFGSKNKKVSKRKSKLEEDSSSGDEEEEEDDEMVENKKKDVISTHEKQLAKRQSEIEQMEKANLEPKTWTMSGEATAAERPKNSALEVELDFEHNMRPAPVITEEVTASLEDIIQKRILEGRFDDVQKAPSIASKAPRELKELDENKSKKGLAEIYEKEYLQKTDPASAPLTFSDEQKKEASMLFKKLCLKLDALSHFHFAPKPVIEDMSIQANVPALAMEEIAPVAVSDAAMLAPEEVFSGKGDIKEEVELSQAERKRRRANKKRKFKAVAAKRMAKKPRDNTSLNHNDGKEES